MSLKSRAQQLKADIPALFLALNSPDTPALARILAALTIRLIPPPGDERLPPAGCGPVAKRETQALVLCTAKRGHMGANCMGDSETMF